MHTLACPITISHAQARLQPNEENPRLSGLPLLAKYRDFLSVTVVGIGAALLVCLLAGWLAGWLASWLVGWLVGWLAGWLVGWLVGWQAVWVFFCLFVCFCFLVGVFLEGGLLLLLLLLFFVGWSCVRLFVRLFVYLVER